MEDLTEKKVKITYSTKSGVYQSIVGKYGVIRRGNSRTYGIEINGENNNSSEYGWFWFDRDEFELVDEFEETPLPIPEMIDGYYIVKCKGAYRKSYSYKCLDKNIKVGDKVVVEDEDNIQTVVGIYNKETATFNNPTKYVVCVIDYSTIETFREKEKKQAELKRKLDKGIKQIQQQIDYEAYADKYPDVAEMLKELDELKETH